MPLAQFPGFRTMLYVGLGFTAIGVVAGFGAAYLAGGFSNGFWWQGVLIATAAFGFSGFLPLILVIAGRPGRYLTSLRIDPDSFGVQSSNGKRTTVRWDDADLSITVLQPDAALAAGRPPSDAEDLLVMPGRIEGRIGHDARTALMSAARAHGLDYGEERFSAVGKRRGAPPVPVLARTAARTSFGSLFAAPPTSPVAAAVPPAPPGGAQTFDLSRAPKAEYADEQDKANTLQRMTVSAAGLELVDAKGRTFQRAWSARDLKIELLRRLTSPLDRLDRPTGSWLLQVGPGGFQGRVGGDAATALVAAASAAQLEVVTSRFPGFDVRPKFWLARIVVRPARAAPQ